MNATTPATDDHPTLPYSRDCSSSSTLSSSSLESVTIERRNEYAAVYRWTIFNSPIVKTRILWSKYFEVGGYDCRLLVYPKGDSQALPGYISIYLQIIDPRGTSSTKLDCFASYRLTVVNLTDDSKSIQRDSPTDFRRRRSRTDGVISPHLQRFSTRNRGF
ncbi:putative ubiquitinyl hydrolase 1 [Helianthus annuus]|uniref:Ubiquitinyl hydrolase 1 n=1 Tax=Helianthus annuus TaxID=4232 RepID=A0A9K3N7X6_HELAN|nr:putative ubiquitinyl hydrolase 1 [Helianthus annuus]